MLSLLMSVHDNNGHYEEAYIRQENQNDWNNERIDERCHRIQIAAVGGCIINGNFIMNVYLLGINSGAFK